MQSFYIALLKHRPHDRSAGYPAVLTTVGATNPHHNTIEPHNSLDATSLRGARRYVCYGFMDEAGPVLDAGQRSIVPTYRIR